MKENHPILWTLLYIVAMIVIFPFAVLFDLTKR